MSQQPDTLHRIMRALLIGVCIIMLCVFMALPFIWAWSTSLKSLDDALAFPPRLTFEDPHWENYHRAITRMPLIRFMFNSWLISSTSVVGAVLTSAMAGYALARLRFTGRSMCILAVVTSMLIPAQALMIPRFLIYDQLGWIGSYKPLIVPAWLGGGAFNIFLFRQFFRTMPREYEDAAYIDGATTWHIFKTIALPFARPAVITAALLSFVFHWREFLDPLLYLTDFTQYPVSLGLRMYQSMAGVWINELMAASLISCIPVVILFAFAQRHIMSGLGNLKL